MTDQQQTERINNLADREYDAYKALPGYCGREADRAVFRLGFSHGWQVALDQKEDEQASSVS